MQHRQCQHDAPSMKKIRKMFLFPESEVPNQTPYQSQPIPPRYASLMLRDFLRQNTDANDSIPFSLLIWRPHLEDFKSCTPSTPKKRGHVLSYSLRKISYKILQLHKPPHLVGAAAGVPYQKPHFAFIAKDPPLKWLWGLSLNTSMGNNRQTVDLVKLINEYLQPWDIQDVDYSEHNNETEIVPNPNLIHFESRHWKIDAKCVTLGQGSHKCFYFKLWTQRKTLNQDVGVSVNSYLSVRGWGGMDFDGISFDTFSANQAAGVVVHPSVARFYASNQVTGELINHSAGSFYINGTVSGTASFTWPQSSINRGVKIGPVGSVGHTGNIGPPGPQSSINHGVKIGPVGSVGHTGNIGSPGFVGDGTHDCTIKYRPTANSTNNTITKIKKTCNKKTAKFIFQPTQSRVVNKTVRIDLPLLNIDVERK